jgi:hypothetical protein
VSIFFFVVDRFEVTPEVLFRADVAAIVHVPVLDYRAAPAAGAGGPAAPAGHGPVGKALVLVGAGVAGIAPARAEPQGASSCLPWRSFGESGVLVVTVHRFCVGGDCLL